MKTLFISGTSKGLGYHLADHYLDKGYHVIGCSRSESTISHNNYAHLIMDMADVEQITETFKVVRKEFKHIHALINNAGMSASYLTSLHDPLLAERCFQVNTLGPMMLCKEACRVMRRQPNGRIINISSVHVPLSMHGASTYSATKAALEQYSKVLAKEVYTDGICVNNLRLSLVKDLGMAEELDQERQQQLLERTICKRAITVSEITHSIDFLLSDSAQSITAETITLGGV